MLRKTYCNVFLFFILSTSGCATDEPRQTSRDKRLFQEVSATLTISPGPSRDSNSISGKIEQRLLESFPNAKLTGVRQAADYVISVDVLNKRVRRSPFQQETKHCAQYSEPDRREGSFWKRALSMKCVSWETKRVSCENKIFELEVQLRGTSTAGSLLLSGTETFSETLRYCGNRDSSDLQQIALLEDRAADWAIGIMGQRLTRASTYTNPLISASGPKILGLDPEKARSRPNQDALAIIIGIENYKRAPKADFANEDAKRFYEYAVRALGVKPENIKLLLDDQADEVAVFKAFQTWLPVKVTRQKSDLYVFFSGHGLPAEDGKSLYLLPHDVDRDLIRRTAIDQSELFSAINASQPRSVTLFIDACYSGQTRSGQSLIENARPLSVSPVATGYPANFSVFSASFADQLSSSSPNLRHGLFSFFLMRGLEGEADANTDGTITNGEMQDFLSQSVARFALTINRKQQPQFVGDANKSLANR